MIIELNKQDAASWLGISAPTLDRWIKQGKVKVRRIPDARVGQQSVVCLIEAPDVASAPEPVPVPTPEPAPETQETADARFAREYLEGIATDSFGNSRLTPDKLSALGPAPILPPPEVTQDAAAKWAKWRSKYIPNDGLVDAAGPLAGRTNWYSKSEQEKRRQHDRAVIAASFPKGDRA